MKKILLRGAEGSQLHPVDAGADNDDRIVFSDDVEGDAGDELAKAQIEAWRILIADDDEEVHRATEFALRGVKIDGAPLELLHAMSAAEARTLLASEPRIAVAMLDVVMESTDAGLKLVEIIRQELGLKNLRIILRTGQPGYAPELEVIRRCDINDYRTKSELTQVRLITTLTSSIRAYAQLEQIALASRGMRDVARNSNALFRIHDSAAFAMRLLDTLGTMLDVAPQGLVCCGEVMDHRNDSTSPPGGLQVVGGAGAFEGVTGLALETLADVEVQRLISRCIASHATQMDGSRFCLWLGYPDRDAVVYFDAGRVPDELESRLIELLAANLCVGFENVDLFERLNFFAFFDPLTRLPNRTRFIAEVDQDIYANSGTRRCMAIADVVRFSDINDALGHRCGDTLLAAVAKRLRAAVGQGVRCARISGDVFALFGDENLIDPAVIRRAFESPFFVHGHALSVGVRLGLVRVGDTRGGAMDLVRNANLALNEARHASGAGYAWFSSELAADVQSRVALLHSLRAAIDFKRGLSLVYQPQINAITGELLGAEALLRWHSDFGEAVPPAQFIPLAERTGMIAELGLWVIESAMDQLAAWRKQGLNTLCMSINVSSVQFRADDFALRVRKLIDLCDVPASNIVFEITESIAVEDLSLVMSQISALRNMGIRFAIDDFGTGFSSLSQIASLPADELKIDRSFVEKVDLSEADRALSAMVVVLARARSLTVVAEGVETDAQREALLAMGCERMQGYLFGRPMTAERFDVWRRERKAV
ncbi:putative bifunctional diguanylate cyclase/phosphodiesterase [Viridibacterium curvum]|uniref:EAL domain-containing protein n=1 Tax=Viridibacterium curvum TaxID=1101404 RepID=A0ABP9QC02_9RHOO